MKIPEDLCPCNSGKMAVECCYQLRPPIDRESAVRINGVHGKTTMTVYNSFGIPMTPPLPSKVEFAFKTSDLFEPDDFIHGIMKQAHHDIASRRYTQRLTERQRVDIDYEQDLVTRLHRNIRAAFYHLQGFIFRYRRLAQQFEQGPVHVDSGVKVIEDDLPLELEFESYMTRYRTCIELTMKLIALKATGIDPRSKKYDFKKTMEYISKNKDTSVRQAIAQILTDHEAWINKQRLIRHDIVHDGISKVLQSFEHIRGVTLNATVFDRTAYFICTEMFNDITDFCGRIFVAIYEQDANNGNG